jgi:Transposase domain (DUF772)
MPRFKPVHKGLKLLPVDFEKQVQPGSFEHALCYLIDYELDLSEFHARYNNDDEGAPAYDPAVLLKIILLAYSRGIGIVASRRIEAACRENVLFIAVSGDSQPNFTTWPPSFPTWGITVSQALQAGEVDRFAVMLTARSMGMGMFRVWQLRPTLVTSEGEVVAEPITVGLPWNIMKSSSHPGL